ncbi:MAG: head-tail connector protein [Rhodobiaceae bacterium]|nr:head-tail connector protein [Rhodobiaceae bacterium]
MALYLNAPPAVEPVTLADAKAHLRIDDTAEDAYVQALIVSARVRVEVETRRALVTQSWTQTLDRWPDDAVVALQIAPVQSVTTVTVRDENGVAQTVSSGLYDLDGESNPPRLVVNQPVDSPATLPAGIAITFVAGYGDAADDVPADIRQAMLLLIADWFEHRDPLYGSSQGARLPAAAEAILGPYRMVHL